MKEILLRCFREIKWFINKNTKYKFLKPQIQCPKTWYGNAYGGFYANPTKINADSVVYSIGIGEDISFDEDLRSTHNCNIFCFDPTPKSIKWFHENNYTAMFSFFNYGIGPASGFVDFHLPKNETFVSGSIINQKNVDKSNKITVQIKTLDEIVNELNHSVIDVLKMDIEGSEYDVIPQILGSNIEINQILIEFHDRYVENGLYKTREIIKMLNRKGYKIFAVSKSFHEVSFVREDLLNNV